MPLRRITVNGYHQTTARFDAVAGGVGQEGSADCRRRHSGVLVEVFQENVHSTPVTDDSRPRAVLPHGRPRHRRAVGRLFRPATRAGIGYQSAAAPHDVVPGPQTPGKKRGLEPLLDRKSTRLNSSHLVISYAVFCLKKKIKMT